MDVHLEACLRHDRMKARLDNADKIRSAMPARVSPAQKCQTAYVAKPSGIASNTTHRHFHTSRCLAVVTPRPD